MPKPTVNSQHRRLRCSLKISILPLNFPKMGFSAQSFVILNDNRTKKMFLQFFNNQKIGGGGIAHPCSLPRRHCILPQYRCSTTASNLVVKMSPELIRRRSLTWKNASDFRVPSKRLAVGNNDSSSNRSSKAIIVTRSNTSACVAMHRRGLSLVAHSAVTGTKEHCLASKKST